VTRAFEYAVPTTAEQAVALLAARGAMPLGGGSDLLSLVKDGVVRPARLVGLDAVGGLDGVERRADGLALGALATLERLAADATLAAAHPALARALGRVAGPQIRAVGTLGGNLCQRPRCWYFRRGYGLLALRGGRSMVLDGDDRYHAVLGNDGPAYFVHPSTVAPLLVALGARAEVLGPGGSRTVPVADLYRTPRRPEESELTLGRQEIVVRVVVPAAGPGRRAASYEVRQRRTLDWSLATASVALALDGGRVREARIVLGQVAPVPWRARGAETELAGREPTAEVVARAARAAVAEAKALRTNGYKIRLAETAVRRAIARAAEVPASPGAGGGA